MESDKWSVRVGGDLAVWADAYCKERGWSRSLLVTTALENLRVDALGGPPEPARPVVGPMVGQTQMALGRIEDAKAEEFARRPRITPEKAALFAEGKLPLSD